MITKIHNTNLSMEMIFVIFFVIFFSTGEDVMKIFDESSKILRGML